MREKSLLPGTVLLVDISGQTPCLMFEAPEREFSCPELTKVPASLAALEAARKDGFHLAGFLAYELGFAFEEKLRQRWTPDGDPLLWFGAYRDARPLSLSEAKQRLAEAAGTEEAGIEDFGFAMDRQAYDAAFARIRSHLAKGDIYQVNFTLRASFSHHGPPERLFLELLRKQPVQHAAFVKLADRSLLSLSPELFLEREGSTLRTRPMKGTAPRGRYPAEDRAIARQLTADPKQRAENTMIVDLMRNDLSRISEAGSVKVTSLCEVERYKSLHQMTSTVEAQLKPEVTFPDVVGNLFPCGSITGAPKLSAMQIAHDLESGTRGVYTGSIGHIAPNGDFRFNVAIRTLDLRKDGFGMAGTGSGVVYDSGAAPEYDECALKLKFLTEDVPSFGLIETFVFHPGEGYFLMDRHMARLGSSADYFGFSFDESTIRAQLADLSSGFIAPRRVRLELAEDGSAAIAHTAFDLTGIKPVWNLVLVETPVSSTNLFLFHKTTNRAFLDGTRAAYVNRTGCQEVLFVNEHGFLTEGSYTTLFVERNRRLLTPALHHGLLPGTFREGLLDNRMAQEADLTPADLASADAIYVGNSVRGLIRCRVTQAAEIELENA